MDTELDHRIQTLRVEFERGQQELARLDSRRQEVRDTLLRISGAIQVLEELLAGRASEAHTVTSLGKPEPAPNGTNERC
jgi:hypothetical protein